MRLWWDFCLTTHTMALIQQPYDSLICNRMLVINKDVKLCHELIQYNFK